MEMGRKSLMLLFLLFAVAISLAKAASVDMEEELDTEGLSYFFLGFCVENEHLAENFCNF